MQEKVWDYYTPTPDSPRPHRRHLFDLLRAEGWTVTGLSSDNSVSTTGDRMLTIPIGHGGYILEHTVQTVFINALGLTKAGALRLAKDLNQHQALAAAKIHSSAASIKRNTSNTSAANTSAGNG